MFYINNKAGILQFISILSFTVLEISAQAMNTPHSKYSGCEGKNRFHNSALKIVL